MNGDDSPEGISQAEAELLLERFRESAKHLAEQDVYLEAEGWFQAARELEAVLNGDNPESVHEHTESIPSNDIPEPGPKLLAYWTDEYGRYWQFCRREDLYWLRGQVETEDGMEWQTHGKWFDEDYDV